MSVGRSPQIDAALAELQRYLQNEISPDAGAGTIALLMAQPPDVVMQHVGPWSLQQASRHSAPVSDILVHALKKFYILGELDLLDREAIANYLDRVTGPALRLCANDDERSQLREKLTWMRASKSTTSTIPVAAPVSRVSPPAPQPPPLLAGDDDALATRRLSLILDRLGGSAAGGLPAAPADPQALAQMLTMAATSSKSGQQFNEYLDQIRPLAGAAGGNVFVILGGGLPSWDLPTLPGTVKPPAQIGAMEKIIDLAEDPAMAMDRFRELVNAAVDKFNAGSLAATVWMLDVAQNTITDRQLEALTVNAICSEAAERISSVKLRQYVESKGKHAALRIALDFFPTLRMEPLFRLLRGEPRAERRRTLLGHLEAHLSRGRELTLNELERELGRTDVDTYYLRNLIYLLHRIERESLDGLERELAALERSSARGQNIYVVKEAATALGQIKTEASVALLTTRLAEFESILLRSDRSMYPIDEMQKLLDRIVSAIARIGTPAALLTVARHGMKANPLLGDTRARLAALSQHDLSFEEEAVEVLLKALRDEIPGKLLGRLVPKRQEGTLLLIEALSGTRSDATDELFADIARRFPVEDIGRAAAKILERGTVPKKTLSERSEPAATLTGELEFFGLPTVMQSLGEMRATGMVTLSTKQGLAVAGLAFVEGKFLNAQRGPLRGTDALYEILERPVAGTFTFVAHSLERMKSTIEPREIMGLLFEGVRRHDELQQLIALIPDDLKLAKGSVKPTPHEEEQEPTLVREVWIQASSGNPVKEWGGQINADSYRIRRLIAHWLETGALVQASG
ncbi:MAG: DUF4388 domain-containing protein [Acidobacteriota bacterium]